MSLLAKAKRLEKLIEGKKLDRVAFYDSEASFLEAFHCGHIQANDIIFIDDIGTED